MGQKVNPIGLRLGINRTWDSRWFARRDYGPLLLDDLGLRKFLQRRLSQAGLSRIVIERHSLSAIVAAKKIPGRCPLACNGFRLGSGRQGRSGTVSG